MICSEEYCKPVCILLGVQAELSMISSELTTVLGMAYGFSLMFGMDLLAFIICITVGTVLLLLLMALLDNYKTEALYILNFLLVISSSERRVAHRELSMEDRARLCDCLNVEKLSLEACKDLTKNPRIPAEISVQAMVSQQSRLQINTSITDNFNSVQTQRSSLGAQSEKASTLVVIFDENNDLRSNLKRMQSRVNELEKVCWEIKGQMSRIGKSKSFSWPSTHHSGRGTPRLC